MLVLDYLLDVNTDLSSAMTLKSHVNSLEKTKFCK